MRPVWVQAKDTRLTVERKKFNKLMLPVVSAGAEHLVMGYLMRRNILTYKAPVCNEGYDLICIHPSPRHRPAANERPQVRVQVKSRYATDGVRAFLVKPATLDAFDFLVVAFLNIGKFNPPNNGSVGMEPIVFYTLPAEFVRQHFRESSSWTRFDFKGQVRELAEAYRGDAGFEQVAQALGVPRPTKNRTRDE